MIFVCKCTLKIAIIFTYRGTGKIMTIFARKGTKKNRGDFRGYRENCDDFHS